MAVAVVQQATAQSGSSLVSTLTATFGATTGTGDRLLAAVSVYTPDGIPIGPPSGWTLLASSVANGIGLYLFSATVSAPGTPQSLTVNLTGATYVAIWAVEFSGCNALQTPVFVDYATPPPLGLNQVSTSVPLSSGILTGDLAFGLFVQYQSGVPTPQGSWTEIADLNSSASAAQLEVQQSPAATGPNQNFTAKVTWPQPTPSIAAVIVASSSSPVPLVSQVPLLALAQDASAQKLRSSQVPVSVLSQDADNQRIHASQVPLSALAQNSPNEKLRASQVTMLALVSVPIRVSQVPELLLARGTPQTRASQVVALALVGNAPGRRRTIDDEWMMYP